MTDDKLMEEINRLIEENTIDSYQKAIELIRQSKNSIKYKSITNRCEIRLLELKIDALSDSDKMNRINLNGKLINLYKKQVLLEKQDSSKMSARYKLLELQKQQKELVRNYKKQNKDIKLHEKVALTVKDIANTINVFLNEKDLLTKVKNIIKETSFGTLETTAFMIIIALISPVFGGIGFSLSTIAKALPVASYVGLTSVIRNCLSKTQFQEFQYYQSEEYNEYVKQFKEENQTLLNEFNNLLNEKNNCVSTEEKLNVNEGLIKKLDEISSKIKDDGLRRTYQLQAYGFVKENKNLCQKVIDDYLDGRSDNKKRHKEYQEKLSKINMEMFKRGNSIEAALKAAGKEAGLSLSVTIIAKAIMTLVAPNSTFSIKSINSFVIPLFLALTNGITSAMSYSGKLKYLDTETEQEIKPKDKEKFNQLFGGLKLQAAY